MNWLTRALSFVFPAASFSYAAMSLGFYYPPVPMEIKVRNAVLAKMRQSFITQEGFKEVTYIDSEGHITGGIGHRLTSLEKFSYPKGSKVPSAKIEEWWIADSRRALDAAMSQAKELGRANMESIDFILALTHVNFQLGMYWRTKFSNTWKYLKLGQASKAISNLNNSLWAKQTPVRVANFVQAIREEYA